MTKTLRLRFSVREFLIFASIACVFLAVINQKSVLAGVFFASLIAMIVVVVGFSTSRSHLVRIGLGIGTIVFALSLFEYSRFSARLMNAHSVPMAELNRLAIGTFLYQGKGWSWRERSDRRATLGDEKHHRQTPQGWPQNS